jgi:hypothetical protein
VCWLQSDLFDFDQRSVVGVVVVVVEVADGFVVGVGVFVGGLALVPVVCVVWCVLVLLCVVCVCVCVVCVCVVCVCVCVVCVCCQTVSPSKLLSKLQVSDHEPHRERCIHNNYC